MFGHTPKDFGHTPKDEGYVLFFTPEAGVLPHFAAQCVAARTLQEKGHRVLMVRCGGVYSRCPVMDMKSLPHTDVERNKENACGGCRDLAHACLEAYGLESVNLLDLLTPALREEIQAAIRAAPRDLRQLTYEGIEFGKLCMMAVAHTTKTSDFEAVSPQVRNTWEQYIASAITSYVLVLRLCERVKIQSIVTHEDYSLLVAARLAGRARGIPTVTMTSAQHMGGDRRRCQFFHTPGWGQAFLTVQSWPQFRELVISPDRVKAAMDDVVERFQAKSLHVYSPRKSFRSGDLRDEMGIPKDRRLLVLYTSSLDEFIACTSQQDALDLPRLRFSPTFKDQIAWIRAVMDFVRTQEGYYLVVRVHPREGKNNRDAIRSQHLALLQEAFGGEYENCTIIWPEMPVSSYDLAEIADLVLVSWSTVGLELSRLGVPVLASTYGNAPRPWDDFHEWAVTPSQYFKKITDMLSRAPSLEACKHAFRWYILHYFGYTLDFSDIIPARDFGNLPYFQLPACADQLTRTLVGGEDVLDVYRSQLSTKQELADRQAEDEELRWQLRRALHFLLTQEDPSTDFTLILAHPGQTVESIGQEDRRAVHRGNACLIVPTLEGVQYFFGYRSTRRYSPMALRLAQLSFHRLAQLGPQDGRDASREELGRSTPDGMIEARSLRDAGQLEQARSMALASLADQSESPEWLNFLGHLDWLEGQASRAKDTLMQVVRRWPAFAQSHNNLAAIYFAEGDPSRSLEHLIKALEAMPDDRDIVMNGVRILMAMGKKEEARTLCGSYVEVNPDDGAEILACLDDFKNSPRGSQAAL